MARAQRGGRSGGRGGAETSGARGVSQRGAGQQGGTVGRAGSGGAGATDPTTGQPETGRAGTGRAGTGRAGTGRAGTGRAGTGRSGGLAEARRYNPRGRTVREHAQASRADPFRPALEILQGGRAAPGQRRGQPDPAPKPRRQPEAPPKPRRPSDAAQVSRRQPDTSPKPRRQARPAILGGRRSDATSAKRVTGLPPRARGAKARPPKRHLTPARTGRPKLADARRRLRLATVLALALFAVIAIRLVQLQIADAAAYAAAGLADRLHRVDLPAPRGTIYDRDGNILVHSVEARYVYADPTLIEDPEATADKVFAVLAPYGVSRSALVAKMSKHKQPGGTDESKFEYLARGIDIADGDRVKALRLPGVDVRRDERREVPGADLAANLLGFIGRGDDHKGLAGLENGYDPVLRGADGWRKFEVGQRDLDKEIPGGYTQEKAARPGGSLQLTIDRDLQYDVQSTLSQRMQTEQATFGCAVVMDVRTGEVVAQASYPGFDAARPFDFADAQRTDACTEKIIDPGSIHKAVVVGAALQEGAITPQTSIPVGPSITKGDTTYHDSHPHNKDTPMTIPGILALSSNIGTIKIADLLGKQRLYDYQRRFGLGEKCGEGLPNEAPGQLLPPDKWSGSSPGSIPIGNGVAVTALQMAAVYAAIANDGLWVQPHLVRATMPADGKPVPAPAPLTRRVLDPQHAAELRTMLEGVTTLDEATGKLAAIPQYRIAGKTGTAKLPQNGGYAPGTVVSFIGLAPADAPRYVVAVVAHTPRGAGGSIAAPAFHDMMAFTLAHFGVVPTGTTPPQLSIYP